MRKHSKEFYDKKYNEYLKAYKNAEQKNKKYNLPMADVQYSRDEFNLYYDAMSIDEGIQKKKKSISSLLAQRQQFEAEYTRKQRALIRKYAKANLNISQANTASSVVSEYYGSLKAQGYSSKDIKVMISSDIFGSP